MDTTTTILERLLPQLGFSAVFAVALWRIYIDSGKKIAEKDLDIKELNFAVQQLYIRNTELLTQLRDNIFANTRSIEANTEAIRSLEKHI